MVKLFGKVDKEVLFYRFLSYVKKSLGETVAPAKLPILEYTFVLEILPQEGIWGNLDL